MWVLLVVVFYGSGNMKAITMSVETEAQCHQYDQRVRKVFGSTVAKAQSDCFKLAAPFHGAG